MLDVKPSTKRVVGWKEDAFKREKPNLDEKLPALNTRILSPVVRSIGEGGAAVGRLTTGVDRLQQPFAIRTRFAAVGRRRDRQQTRRLYTNILMVCFRDIKM